jgi:hypothetical protein
VAMAGYATSACPHFASKQWVSFKGASPRLPRQIAWTVGAGAFYHFTCSSAGRNSQVCEIACRTNVDPKTDVSCRRRHLRIR